MPDAGPELQPGLADPEERKLATLARSARVRIQAAEGACVRDLDGRTYAGATIDLPALQLSAVAVAVAMAASSGARGLEAAAVLTDADDLDDADMAVLRDLAGSGVPVLRVDARGQVLDRTST